ncbi:MAG: hypothetical protein WDW38_009229 [Sanguina aurantia]
MSDNGGSPRASRQAFSLAGATPVQVSSQGEVTFTLTSKAPVPFTCQAGPVSLQGEQALPLTLKGPRAPVATTPGPQTSRNGIVPSPLACASGPVHTCGNTRSSTCWADNAPSPVLPEWSSVRCAPRSPPARGTQLFVAGLNFITTEREVETKFARFGRVKEVRIVRHPRSGESRGFGFVVMEQESSCHEAIRELDGRDWQGRRLDVEVSKNPR